MTIRARAKRAGQGRQTENRAAKRRRQQNMILIIAGVLLAALIGLVVYVNIRTTLPVGGETIFSTQGNTHIPFGSQSPVAYNSIPPSSGPHYDNLAAWKVYQPDDPQRYEFLNHNLEDGGVLLYYQCEDGCPELLQQLEDLVGRYHRAGKHVAVAPNDPSWVEEASGLTMHQDMEAKIAAVAWQRVLKMDEFDGEALTEFIDRYEGIDHHQR